MATLQKIRDKAGILIAVVIGLSLLSFILSDFISKGTMGGGAPDLGEINGQTISIQEYQATIDELVETTKRNNGSENIDSKTMESIYDQAWELLVSKYTMDEEFEMLGIGVSASELEDMIKGKFIDPQIQQIPIFQNEQTKMFDKTRVISFLKNLDQDPSGVARASWLAFEKALIENKKVTKYNTLMQKGYYSNKLEVADQVKGANESVSLQFVLKRYTDIKDEDVTFNDADLKKYFDEHVYMFNQETSRSLTYVTFDVLPSEADAAQTKTELEKQRTDFVSEKDPIKYINLNSDEPFADVYFKKGELPTMLDSLMFAADSGMTTAVYQEGNAFKVARLVNVKELPDSAKARHILLQPSETESYEKITALKDSLVKLIKGGADFAALAKQYSKDGSAQTGGDLNWFQKGQMVGPFEKACFEAKKGEIVTAETQFGVHIIEVQEIGAKQKKIQVGYLVANIIASDVTDSEVYNKASKFIAENRTKEQFEKSIDTLKLIPRVANNIKNTDRNIAGLESPRELIRWAYKSELNAVSEEVMKFGDKYVVALLTGVREKGETTFEDVKTDLEVLVIKEKKAELMIKDFTAAKSDDLNAMAQKLNLQVQTADKVTFNAYSIPGAGNEAEAIAYALYGPANKVQAPIKGTSGVLAIKTSAKATEEKATPESEKERLAKEFANRVNYQASKAIKENANIVDNRLFYY